MSSFLVFTLQSPLAAMGDIAVGERRYGAERPAKSAILGLVAAALGIERADESTHRALSEGYGYAVRWASVSPTIADYHTVQAPPARRGRRWATRHDELAEPDLGTTVSIREYRMDACVIVSLWTRQGSAAPFALPHVVAALRTPVFTLYFGRKGCPLARPLFPMLVDAANLRDAFENYEKADRERRYDRVERHYGPVHADLDARAFLGDVWREDRIVSRRDHVVSRRRWQFGLREEVVVVSTQGEGGPG